MSKSNSVVAVFPSHTAAEAAIEALQESNFDMKKLSIIGRDHSIDEHVVGYYNVGDQMNVWGHTGAFWGELWISLEGSGFFWIPSLGPLLVAGPLVNWIVRALEGNTTEEGLSVIGASLSSQDMPKDSILRYETAIKAGKFVLIAYCSSKSAVIAMEVFKRSKSESLDHHKANQA
jgi:hypothetical protein